MKETKIGGIQFTDDTTTNNDPYIIALFGEENVGKTRFALTGPELLAVVPLEMKAYVTLEKDSLEFDKKVLKPKDPMSLIVQARKVGSLPDDIARQRFYDDHVKKVKETVYTLLEHPDVRVVMIDKFTTLVTWFEYAINGMSERFIKVDGKVYKDRKELNQTIIDFLNSLSQFKKPVVLTNASKDDYEVLGTDKKPIRKTWDSFKYLGSHCNVVAELRDNKHWDPSKEGDRYSWHYELAVRRCQRNPGLEGPLGNPLLRDEDINLPRLIQAIEGDDKFDPEVWM